MRSRLAQRIFEHEYANNHAPQANAPHSPALTKNPGVSEDVECPSCYTGRQQPPPTSGSQISPDQLSQLCELIAETVGSQRFGSGEAPGLLADMLLLSPGSSLNIAATRVTQLSLRQLVPSLPQAP